MPSLTSAGMHGLLVMLFCSTARSMQILSNATRTSQLPSRDLHLLAARDVWDDYETDLRAFLAQPTCSPSDSPPTGDMLIAIASYIDPSDSVSWGRLAGYSPTKVPILVANAVSGPDSSPSPSWQAVINEGSASGKLMLGYVRTGYFSQNAAYTPDGVPYKTRLLSTSLNDWIAQIQSDVDAWYSLYSNIGGIFFDEGWFQCGSNNEFHDAYKFINDYTKRNHQGAYTVLNPGSAMDSCFEDTMDTLLTFEGPFSLYSSPQYQPNTWTPKDPRKLWHIIHTLDESDISTAAALVRKNGAGLVQMTNDKEPNPYDNLPSESYMQEQIIQAAGGSLLNSPPSDWPSGGSPGTTYPRISSIDYSSITIVWNTAINALAYNIYLDKPSTTLVASLPSSMTSTTIGGLLPGTHYYIRIAVIGGGGEKGVTSLGTGFTTTALPTNKYIDSLSVTSAADSSVFTAQVYAPFSFLRVFIWNHEDCGVFSEAGWPIDVGRDALGFGHAVCALYMLENGIFYEYIGTFTPGVNAPFSWNQLAKDITTQISNQYTYSWTLPIGTNSGLDLTEFAIQGQGYNPLTNAISNTAYNCKGSSFCTSEDDFVLQCEAAQYLIRFDFLYNTQGSAADTGECSGGCGIFIQGGSNCAITGKDLYSAFTQITTIGPPSGPCAACGSWKRAYGCEVTINFVSSCGH